MVGVALAMQGRVALDLTLGLALLGLLLVDMHLFLVAGHYAASRRLRRELRAFAEQFPLLQLTAHPTSMYVDEATIARLRGESNLHFPAYIYEAGGPGPPPLSFVAFQTFVAPGIIVIGESPAELRDDTRFLVYHELAHASMWGLGTRLHADGPVVRPIVQAVICAAAWGIWNPVFVPIAFALYGFGRWRVEGVLVNEIDEARADGVAIWAFPDGPDLDAIVTRMELRDQMTALRKAATREALADRRARGRLVGDPPIAERSAFVRYWPLVIGPISLLSAAATGLTMTWWGWLVVALRSVMRLETILARRFVTAFLTARGVAASALPWSGNDA